MREVASQGAKKEREEEEEIACLESERQRNDYKKRERYGDGQTVMERKRDCLDKKSKMEKQKAETEEDNGADRDRMSRHRDSEREREHALHTVKRSRLVCNILPAPCSANARESYSPAGS